MLFRLSQTISAPRPSVQEEQEILHKKSAGKKDCTARLTGDEIRRRVEQYGTAVEEPLTNPPGYGNVHKWTKKSIFWDLPYWNTHLIRHNLDVMHIEKNVFDNIFNTVMDIKGKTKDNLNARKDLKNICNRPELEVDERRPNAMPKAAYTLTKEQKKKICEWVRSLRFPDGYASNIARCVDIANLRVHGMKSHDCHVFMQKLIPVAFRELLPEFVWSALTELSSTRWSTSLFTCHTRHVWEDPCSIGGCTHLREIGWFTSHYFESHVTCKRHRPSRNDELTQNNDRVARDIFNHPGRTSGVSTKRYALGQERHVEPELQNIEDDLLKSLYWGPNQLVTTWSCYFVNGYNFHTEEPNIGKSTMNCGVCVKSSSYTDTDIDFYGMLEEIIQLDYPVIDGLQVVLFKCKWVDPTRGMKVHPRYHLVDVNFKRVYQKDEPFILAQQAVQVYYTDYPSMRRDRADWMAVCKTKARRVVDASRWTDVAYQLEEVEPPPKVNTDNQTYDLHDPNGLVLLLISLKQCNMEPEHPDRMTTMRRTKTNMRRTKTRRTKTKKMRTI
ncbi:UNVERIFIED_CONTAM: hypothetical protein Sradi_0477300 [Sesamum radiatum]|uniref:DUF4216 domain-containing protein n=1 Tax=Sesamum radiatum TaxID=300843 RepID=A0AAW2W7A1_SESRA